MGQVIWNPLLPGPVLGLAVGVLGVLALLAAWRTRRTWPLWANLCALGLRGIALACAALLILRPETVRRESQASRPPLLVVVDDSQSLRLVDAEGGVTRAEQAKPALAQLLSEAAKRTWEVQAFDAGARLEPRHPQDDALRASAPVSPLGECLAEAAERGGGENATESTGKNPRDKVPATPAGAAVLFTDGCVNRGRPLVDAAGLLARRGTPLFVVALGQPGLLPPDAWLEDLTVRRDEESAPGSVDASSGPRVGQRLVVEARALLAPGSQELPGPLGDTIARLQVAAPAGEEAAPGGQTREAGAFVEAEALRHRLRPAPAWTPVRLRFTPPKPGFYRLRLSLDPFQAERQRANNFVYASVEVLPPRRRVSYLASRLGHDYRRLKDLFARWDGPEVEILPDFVKPPPPSGGVPQEWPAETHLAQRTEESVSAAARPGTLIWEEPDLTHLSLKTQARLRGGIEAGEWGVIWVLNEAPEAFGRRVRGTPLEDACLFRDFSAPAPAAGPALGPFPVSSRPVARKHPLTQWAFEAGPGIPDPFQALGAASVWGPLQSPRPEVTTLLAAGPQPLLCTGTVGKGRVALLACGESWRWLAPPKDSFDRRDALAAELWRRLIEWASGSSGPGDPPVRLYLPKDRWDLGETLSARVAVQAQAPGEPVRVEYALSPLAESGGALPPPRWIPWSSEAGAAVGLATAGEGGREAGDAAAPLVFSAAAGTPPAPGEWLLRMRALRSNGAEIGTDRAQLAVVGSSLEERSVRPDFAALDAAVEAAGLAAGTGKPGRVLKPAPQEISALVSDLETRLKPETVWKEERVPAISYPMLLALLLLALTVDAWLRRG